MFSPVTRGMPNRLNTHPPITAPTIPRAMSRKSPSPVLLTSLLPMKPAIRPSTIHAMIDMVCPPGLCRWCRLFDHLIRPQQERLRNREPECLGGLEVDDEIELGGLLNRETGGVWSPFSLISLNPPPPFPLCPPHSPP